MQGAKNSAQKKDLDDVTRFIHLGLTVFGVLAWATGFWAEDYKKLPHLGFSVHKWLGMGLSFFMCFRLWYGFFGPPEAQFRHWVPYIRERLLLILEDIVNLMRLRLPDRQSHQGLAGLVQTFGLAAFAWMAVTGTFMFLFLEPGHKARGLVHAIKELHEVGLWLIPIFLGIHVGAVILHAITGNHVWRRTFFLGK